MNSNIKKITQGSMFLAIYGAALLINRELSFLFDQFVSLISSLVILIYISKFSMKDGVILSFCIFVLSFFFGGTYVLVYTPLSIIGGLVYGYGIKHKFERKTILFLLIVVYTIGEYILMLAIAPLLGFSDFNEYIVIVKEMFAMYNVSFDTATLYSISKVIYGLSIFMIAVMESLLIHMLAVIMFKKFRLGTIKVTPIDQLRIKPTYAYISMLLILVTIFAFRFGISDTITFTLMALSLLGASLLVAQGYIFCLVYGIIVLKKNISFFLILTVFMFMPYSLILLMIFGFLYATGPLYRYIVRKRGF